MGVLTTLRDVVYTRIAVKKAANGFYYANTFALEKTWRPWEQLENLFATDQFPKGKVYVIGGRPGDMMVQSRNPQNLVTRDYPVHVGFQHSITKIEDTAEIDTYANFVEELEETLRLEIDASQDLFAFNRLEPMRDPNGIPLSFILMRDYNLFEAYFTAFYTRPLLENVATTTTT